MYLNNHCLDILHCIYKLLVILHHIAHFHYKVFLHQDMISLMFVWTNIFLLCFPTRRASKGPTKGADLRVHRNWIQLNIFTKRTYFDIGYFNFTWKSLFSKNGPKFCWLAISPFYKISKFPFFTFLGCASASTASRILSGFLSQSEASWKQLPESS